MFFICRSAPMETVRFRAHSADLYLELPLRWLLWSYPVESWIFSPYTMFFDVSPQRSPSGYVLGFWEARILVRLFQSRRWAQILTIDQPIKASQQHSLPTITEHFFPAALQPNFGPLPPRKTFPFISVSRSRTVSSTLWTGDQLVARPLLPTPGWMWW
jgi:hypothetical protein